MKNFKSLNSTVLVFIGLIGISTFFACGDQATADQNTALNKEVNTLKEVRTDLLQEIEGLKTELESKAASNDSLTMAGEEMLAVINSKEAELKKMKKDFSKTADGMANEITQLRQIKTQLNHFIDKMEQQVTILNKANQSLQKQVSDATELNKKLSFEISELKSLNLVTDKELKKFSATSTRTSNFRIDIKKDGNKPTGSSRRAKEIDLSFAVKNLPENRKGTHQVYLSIVNAKGDPMVVNYPQTVVIDPSIEGGLATVITAQQSKTVDLANDVRIQFKQPIESRLNPGFYQANIYTDFGLIGSAQFQLR